MWPALLIYSGLRVLLIAVLAVLLSFLVIPLVALAFAVVLQLPLAWFFFAGQRRKVNAALAHASRSRRADRERLRQALSGEG